MGNQPCKAYLINTARLSRAMRLSCISLGLASVAVEDVILAEMDGERGSISHIIAHLEHSLEHLQCMRIALNALCQEMSEISFRNFPTLHTTDLKALGVQANKEGLHLSIHDWETVEASLKESGFWGTNDLYKKRNSELVFLTTQLKSKVIDCVALVQNKSLHLAFRENCALNFNLEFARLYTAWASFQQEFLAAGLIATELAYRHYGNGSILQESETLSVDE